MASTAVPALARGLEILELLARASRPLSFGEVLAGVPAPRASIARMLRTLRDLGYIHREDATGLYQGGPRLAGLTSRTAWRERLIRGAQPILDRLFQQTGCTVLLLGWDGRQCECLDKRVHPAGIVMQEVGRLTEDLSLDPWCWLFYDSLDATAQRAARHLMARPGAFIRRWPSHCRQFHTDGFACDDQVRYPSIRRLGALVRGADGRPLGALGLGGTVLSIQTADLPAMGRRLLASAGELSAALAG